MSGDDSKNSEISLEGVLCLLDRWRHLPAYQLERRADILFAMFLPEVLARHFELEAEPTIVPEFPIKQLTNFRSKNVDYFAYASDGKHSFLVELKTDMASVSEVQKERLKEAAGEGLAKLVCDTVKVAIRSPRQQKYVHLLWRLQELDLLSGVESVFDWAFPIVRRGVKRKLSDVKVTDHKDVQDTKLVYVAPCEVAGVNTIDFNEFAEVIKKRGADSTRRTFACYLKNWAAECAGSRDPRKWSKC